MLSSLVGVSIVAIIRGVQFFFELTELSRTSGVTGAVCAAGSGYVKFAPSPVDATAAEMRAAVTALGKQPQAIALFNLLNQQYDFYSSPEIISIFHELVEDTVFFTGTIEPDNPGFFNEERIVCNVASQVY